VRARQARSLLRSSFQSLGFVLSASSALVGGSFFGRVLSWWDSVSSGEYAFPFWVGFLNLGVP